MTATRYRALQLQRSYAAPQNMCISIRAAARMDVPKLLASRAARCNYSAATPRPHYRFFKANALPRVSTTRGYAATHTRYARHTLASLAHILVEVANIQMRSLKTEVEKGSIGIVIIYGLVDPKR